MSKPRFHIYFEIDTKAHAETIKNEIQNQLIGKDIFEKHSFSTFQFDSKNYLIGDWRFNKAIDRDAVKDWVRDQAENHPIVKTWIQNAKISWHLCTHDNPEIKDCRTTNYFEWTKP